MLLLFLNRDTGMVLNDIGAVLRNLIPVYDVPPGAYVLGSTVLVFQVISMLPNIQTKDWKLDSVSNPLHKRIVLVRSACVNNGQKQNEENCHSRSEKRLLSWQKELSENWEIQKSGKHFTYRRSPTCHQRCWQLPTPIQNQTRLRGQLGLQI